MKHLKKFFALCLVLALSLSIIPAAFAATVPNATIDTTRSGSIDIYKYDLTRANTDDTAAAMIDSYVSTGVRDTDLEAVLDDGTVNDLGNGQTSYGYAVKGVEFSYLKVADICTYSENEPVNGRQVHKDMILYKFKDTDSAALLSAIGLSNADAYPVTAAFAEAGYHFFVSDTLIDALNAALAANATNVKNALEAYMRNQGSDSFAETDAHGHTSEDGLELGLYLIVETKVPEMVTDTTNPFFASLPMTSVNGTNANNGGQEWLYDIVLYPKNSTGIPSLEKTVRESVDDTGKTAAILMTSPTAMLTTPRPRRVTVWNIRSSRSCPRSQATPPRCPATRLWMPSARAPVSPMTATRQHVRGTPRTMRQTIL